MEALGGCYCFVSNTNMGMVDFNILEGKTIMFVLKEDRDIYGNGEMGEGGGGTSAFKQLDFQVPFEMHK
jgi:hypothetical protein